MFRASNPYQPRAILYRLALGWPLVWLLGCSVPHAFEEPLHQHTLPLLADPPLWEQQAKLVPKDGAANDYFGHAVAIDGHTAVVGTRLDDDNGQESGSAYVYVRDAFGWSLEAKLIASDGKPADQFGHSVAVSGDTILVGAIAHSAAGPSSGAAYVFVRSAQAWTQEAKLEPSDLASGDQFGSSVALDTDTALIGAFAEDEKANGAGAAYIFTRNANTWTQEAKLLAPDGAIDDRFGSSASLSGETALIGAYLDDDQGSGSGSAYTFVRKSGIWEYEAKLTPMLGSATDWFGYSLSLSGDTALIGCHLDDDKGPESGSAFVFSRTQGTWTQEAKLMADDGATFDNFGISVAIDGDIAIIGAQDEDEKGQSAGAAYVFTRLTGLWTQHTKLLAPDGAANDDLGRSAALSGTTAIVGSMLDDDKGLDSGAAYVFAFGLPIGNACGSSNDCTTGFCVDGICCDTACGGDSPNDCQVCSASAGALADGTCTPLPAGQECRSSMGICDIAESCDGQSGDCPEDMLVSDGTDCGMGQCLQGVCEEKMTGMGGMGGMGGTGGTGGTDGGRDPDSIGETGSCGCRIPGLQSPAPDWGWIGFLMGLGYLSKRRLGR